MKTILKIVDDLAPTTGNRCIPSADQVMQTCQLMYKDIQSSNRSGDEGSHMEPTPESQQLEPLERRLGTFRFAMSFAVACRRLYRTSKGRLGLGPTSLQAGDQVWMLRTVRVPFVLRPRDDGSYMFMGETYVHGYMKGEMKDQSDDLEDVVLR
ncbi:hypothetical protein PG996_007309 [Apiospora saccharicola]|uniref:Uncharacterized protein n=1 Tax=Apiospora saccharicola TaxID=335842 RepID=A0ABR1VBC0_9PEZI